MADKKNMYAILSQVNVNENVKSKGDKGLKYLSWASAWAELNKACAENNVDCNYTVYESDALGGLPYFTDGKTACVKVGVTVGEKEIIEWLAVMDYKNNAVPVDKLTMTDVIKTIQRAVTKAIGRHGLGGYIYEGEDLPSEEAEEVKAKTSLSSELEKQKFMLYCTQNDVDAMAIAGKLGVNKEHPFTNATLKLAYEMADALKGKSKSKSEATQPNAEPKSEETEEKKGRAKKTEE